MPRLLKHHFIQLPIRVDSTKLQNELVQTDPEWAPHSLPNMHLVPLVEFTPHTVTPTTTFTQFPYLQKILGNWNIPIGSSRISKLSSLGKVPKHVDVDYYWKHRLRIHIVVQTNPKALFGCGNHTVHLPQGEVWVSDNWSQHWIANMGISDRIHIVVDTPGSEIIWNWIHRGWNSDMLSSQTATHNLPLFEPQFDRDLIYDDYDHLKVRQPLEVQEIISDCLDECPQSHSIAASLNQFVLEWNNIYTQFQDSHRSHYVHTLQKILEQVQDLSLSNGVSVRELLHTQIGNSLMPRPIIVQPTILLGGSFSTANKLFNRISNGLTHTFILPKEFVPNVDTSIWNNLSKYLQNSKGFWRDGAPSDLESPIRWLAWIEEQENNECLLELLSEFPDAQFIILVQSPEQVIAQGQNKTEYLKSLELIHTLVSETDLKNYTLVSSERLSTDPLYRQSMQKYLSRTLEETISITELNMVYESHQNIDSIDFNQPHFADIKESWNNLKDCIWF